MNIQDTSVHDYVRKNNVIKSRFFHTKNEIIEVKEIKCLQTSSILSISEMLYSDI